MKGLQTQFRRLQTIRRALARLSELSATAIFNARSMARTGRFVSFIEQMSLPPEEERRAKTKSEARLNRMDEMNVPFDVTPGI